MLKNGLLSAVVATFTLSLTRLSLDTGDQMVALLTQLVNISTGVPESGYRSAEHSIQSVRVNVTWLLSLILSLCSALLTTSMQKWA